MTPNPSPKGTILLVDDEDGVRGYCKQVLQIYGWHVLAAARADSALQLAEAHTEPIQILITDVVMPAMTGPQLVEELRQKRPDLKVLYMSGYHADDVLQAGIESEKVQFLSKPFRPDALIAKVMETLAG